MKIVHVMPWYMPTHDYQENHLPFQQKELGHDVWIISSDRPSPKFYKGKKYETGPQQDKGVPIVRLKTLFQIEKHGQVYLKDLKHKIKSLQPDVIHAHGPWTIPTLQLIFSRLPSCKLFVDDHADNANIKLHLLNRRAWVWVFRHTLLKVMMRKVDGFISVNPFSQWHLHNNLGIPSNRIFLLPLGVDPEFYFPDPGLRQKIRSQLGIKDDEVVFLFAGAFQPTKGMETLIKAFAQVASQYPSSRLLLIGKGSKDYDASLHQLARTQGVLEKMIFQGWVAPDELNAYYNAGDISVMPGKITASKQAQAVGIPLIVTTEIACNFLISNGSGIAFEKGDHVALSKIMKRYIEEPRKRIEQGRLSLELVMKKLSWSKIVEQSINIYTQSAIAK